MKQINKYIKHENEVLEELKEIVAKNDIKIKDLTCISIGTYVVDIIMPYTNQETVISFEGDTPKKRAKSFKQTANEEIETMIDHLGDCKLGED